MLMDLLSESPRPLFTKVKYSFLQIVSMFCSQSFLKKAPVSTMAPMLTFRVSFKQLQNLQLSEVRTCFIPINSGRSNKKVQTID